MKNNKYFFDLFVIEIAKLLIYRHWGENEQKLGIMTNFEDN
jgi:hypothetical protein